MWKYLIWQNQRTNSFNGKKHFIKTMTVQTHQYYKCNPRNQADSLVYITVEGA